MMARQVRRIARPAELREYLVAQRGAEVAEIVLQRVRNKEAIRRKERGRLAHIPPKSAILIQSVERSLCNAEEPMAAGRFETEALRDIVPARIPR